MKEHHTWQEQIAPFVASRLEGEDRRRFEAHLEKCPDCREMTETWKGIAAAISEEGKLLFDPHPSPATLGRLARGEGAAGDDRVRRHLAVCSTCGLEMDAWQARVGRTKPSPAGKIPRPSPWASRLLWAAAGLVLGVGLGFLGLFPPAGIQTGRTPGVEGIGAVRHLLLPRIQRGGMEAVTFEIGRGQPFVIVDFQPPMPAAATGDARFRFEIVGDDGSPVWSSGMRASEIREHLEAMELVSFLVPAAVLPPGRYEFRVLSPEDNGRPPWYRVPAEIVPSR